MIRKIDILIAELVLGLACSLLFNVFVWEELRELNITLTNSLTIFQNDIDELKRVLEVCQNHPTPPPISKSQAIEIVSEYTGWNMAYLEKYNTSAELWYINIAFYTIKIGMNISATGTSTEYIRKVVEPVSDHSPKRINENETLYYVWIVTVYDPELKYPVPHGVNWYVNAYDGEVIDIFLHH